MTTLMQHLVQLSGQPLVHALGWTLLHFCWQGLAVAALLWCVLRLLGERRYQARYASACVALALMALLPLATFAHLAADAYRAARLNAGVVLTLDSVVNLSVTADASPVPWTERAATAMNSSMPWLLLAWALGVVVCLARLSLGLIAARRMKSAGLQQVTDEFERLFHAVRVRLGIQRAVRIAQSALIEAPTVIGWLRPVVLMPISCLTGFSPQQIEAIFCHELAHVRRHDYLVSVVQSVVEALLFYHPAVWWVSQQVRRERECCCDEFAVANGGDRLAYARALSTLEEQRLQAPQLALAANGGVLKMRITRLLGRGENTAGSQVAATLVLLAMVLGGLCWISATARAQLRTAVRAPLSLAIKLGLPVRHEVELLASPTLTEQIAPAGTVTVTQEGTVTPDGTQPAHGDYKRWLEQDVRWIITDQEAEKFKQLTNDNERDAFIENFWQGRNPNPNSPDNEYRDEYYARIASANEHFATDSRPGWATDRGHIYIVYGKPESVDTHPGGGGAPPYYPYEVWHYKYIAGIGDNVDLWFVDTCKCGDYHYTIDPMERHTLGSVNWDPTKPMDPHSQAVAARLFAQGGASAPQSAAPPPATAARDPRNFQYLMPTIEEATGVPTGISGTIVDPHGALVPGAEVTAVNTDTGAKLSLNTLNSGIYGFPSLPPGLYNVEVQAKGFQRLLQENVRVVAGQVTTLNLKLTVGVATQTLTVTGQPWAPATTSAPPPSPPPAKTSKPSGPQRVSSGVMEGLIISMVQPVYPSNARANHVEGTVVLSARISKQGTVEIQEVLSGPPALIVSAIDAVRQWKYKPFLIDGEPTEVYTTINITYKLGPSTQSPASGAGPQGATATPAASQATKATIRSIDYKGLSTVTIAQVVERFGQDSVGLKLETPYDVARTAKAATVLAQLLAEHGRSNAIVNVAVTPVSPNAVGIQFNVDEGLKGTAQKLAADAAGSQTRFSFSSRLAMTKTITMSNPAYPAIAKAAHVQGSVMLLASVSQSGEVQDLKLISGTPMLVPSAMEQARQIKFDSAKLSGGPSPLSAIIAINFTLGDAAQGGGVDSQGMASFSAETHTRVSIADPDSQELNGVPVRKVGGSVTAPEIIYRVDADYTDEARNAKFMGVVLVNLIVDQRGVPQDVHVLRTLGMGLDEKAVDAVRQYRFKPAKEDGKPVPVALNVEVDFQIRDEPKPQAAANSASGPTVTNAAAQAPIAPQQYDGAPVRKIGNGVTRPELIYQVEPEFTEEARKAKASGTVLVNLVVDKQGLPQNVHILRGFGIAPDGQPDPNLKKAVLAAANGMNQKAMDAVRQYKFNPATADGKPVPVALNVEVNFQVF